MDHRTNKAWQRADDLAVLVYEATKVFPREELYGMTSQIRRAAVSGAANIAEGSGRGSTKDYLRFLYMARGSFEGGGVLHSFGTKTEVLDGGRGEEVEGGSWTRGTNIAGLGEALGERGGREGGIVLAPCPY